MVLEGPTKVGGLDKVHSAFLKLVQPHSIAFSLEFGSIWINVPLFYIGMVA